MNDDPKIISTPRASKKGIVVAIILLLLSALLYYLAYRGWQLHQSLT